MTIRYQRTPQDSEEQMLIEKGWHYCGISLYKYPGIQKAFTKREALKAEVGDCCPTCHTCLRPNKLYG